MELENQYGIEKSSTKLCRPKLNMWFENNQVASSVGT